MVNLVSTTTYSFQKSFAFIFIDFHIFVINVNFWIKILFVISFLLIILFFHQNVPCGNVIPMSKHQVCFVQKYHLSGIMVYAIHIQSTLVISNFTGPDKNVRVISSSRQPNCDVIGMTTVRLCSPKRSW